ncbi:MAG: hypothetical protein Q9M31_06305 [Mariprofundus sp.]|nr:hypothetical protein [Mariprofundus sp.]
MSLDLSLFAHTLNTMFENSAQKHQTKPIGQIISADQVFEDENVICTRPTSTRQQEVELEQKSISIDLPIWMIQQLDEEANRVGVSRQAIIKMWLADRLKESS